MLDTVTKEEQVIRKITVQIVEVRENVSTTNDGDFRILLTRYSEDSACPRVILDLSRMRFINSSGLGAIANMSMRLRKRGGNMIIISPNRELTQVFEVTKLDQVLNIVKDRAAAMAFFEQGD